MKNNAALITGGAKRIGRQIATFLASQGYDIVISYNNSKDEAENLSEEITKKFSVKCKIFQADLRDEKQAKKLADFVSEIFPNWNLLVNNASIFQKSKFLSAPDSALSDNLNLHFTSPLILIKEFAKNSPKNAQVINMVDKNIARYDTSYFYYLLSKKSLAELTKMLSIELAPEIRVNAIAPGFILNPIDEEKPSEKTQNIITRIPLKNKGEVENIIQGVEYLLNNKFVTGQILFIDGGASLNHAG